MAQTKLIAVDQALAFADNSMPQPLIDAWSYTTTFAAGYARTVNKDPSTEAYFNAMTQELMKLGWNVTASGRTKLDQIANRISPAGIVKSILYPYLPPDKQQRLGGLLDAINQPDVKITGFMDFWWKKASVHAGTTNMAMGPLIEVNNASNITMIYYGFNYSADSWRSMFVEQSSAALNVSAYNLQMNLNMALYNSVKNQIIAKITGKEVNHIATTVVDL
jgi:hypothetical protein